VLNSTLLPAYEATSTVAETEIGHVHIVKLDDKGTTRHAMGVRVEPVSQTSKSSLVSSIPGLDEFSIIVSVPDMALDGTKLTYEERAQALYQGLRQGGYRYVPMPTQSGLKEGNIFAVRQDAFNDIASVWDLDKDGPKISVYGGLIASDTRFSTTSFHVKVRAALNGRDGNCEMRKLPLGWGKLTTQFRAMVLGAPITAKPVLKLVPHAFTKGTIVELAGADEAPELNDSQVKMSAFGSPVGFQGDFLIAPCDTTAKLRKVWASCEPILMLRHTPAVEAFLTARTYKEVSELLSLLNADKRGELADRLGELGLNADGTLRPAFRAIGDLIRSNVPNCAEVEDRITRFLVREVTQHVIVSGGIWMHESLLIVNDSVGAKVVEWSEDAWKMGQIKAVCRRLPTNMPGNIVFLDKDPYVKNKGMVVTSAVAALLCGDADGDYVAVSTDPEVVVLFGENLNREINGNPYKPAKSRRVGPLTADAMEDFVVDQWAHVWWFGALTTMSWKLIEAGLFDLAAKIAWLAQASPMAMKFDVLVDGESLESVISREYGALRDECKEMHLQWHDAQDEATKWKSPRQLGMAAIEKPTSLLDACWNAGVKAAQDWGSANPKIALSMTSMKRLCFEAGNKPTSSEWAEFRALKDFWGEYWTPIMKSGGPKPGQDHSYIYGKALDWARNASRGALACVLMTSNSSFGRAFHTVFAAGRGVEILGLHPLVAEKLSQKRGWAQDVTRQAALVEALLETIE
jgi:hypothetical protein